MRNHRGPALFAGVVLLVSACTIEEVPLGTIDDAAPAPAPAEPDAQAPDAEPGADDPMAQGPTSGCVQTHHTEISIDDVTFPSFLEWWFNGTIDGVEVTVVSPEMNNGTPMTTTAADGEARVQMGINAYGDYFPPEVTVDGVMYDFELAEPYTVDADEGADSEMCFAFQDSGAE